MYGEPEDRRHISDIRFTLERDQAEALRLEFSSISPNQQSHLKHLTEQMVRILVHNFGKFFNSGVQEEVAGVSDRIVVTGRENFTFILENWPKDSIVRKIGADFIEGGRMVSEGSIILLTDPQEDMKGKIPDTNRQAFIDYFGASNFEESAMQAELERKAAHELAHVYQYRMLPRLFFESGARYYGRRLMLSLDRKYLTDSDEEEGIHLYQSLIGKHGDWVHMMFFGGHVKVPGGFDKTTQVFDDLPHELYQRLQY